MCRKHGRMRSNGTTHSDITRLSSAYAVTFTENWNGVVFGGIPIFNNGQDIPQMWIGAPALALKLTNLTAWPATISAKIIRNFNSYLVAFNIREHAYHAERVAASRSVVESGCAGNTADVVGIRQPND